MLVLMELLTTDLVLLHVKRFLAPAITLTAGILMSACGGQACACFGQGQIPATPTALPVSTALDGKTITVRRGTVIEVTLDNSFGPPGSSLTWEATSSDSSILLRTSSRVEPSGSPSPAPLLERQERYIADFRAQSPGTAQIIGQGHRTCEAMNPAFCPQGHYTVTVQVTGS